ncbi:hypothetical protein BD310DRAFT_926788 [Dichomitus squalens]|uniref:Uncharacterized protein n=1 Tax=Dichomitus squalens TaxID=114155 RepID=A0A4Q9PVD1_9APHY|nr:hypothetical protein BD310DRAFT_926788 [Dichomitus squalens]
MRAKSYVAFPILAHPNSANGYNPRLHPFTADQLPLASRGTVRLSTDKRPCWSSWPGKVVGRTILRVNLYPPSLK